MTEFQDIDLTHINHEIRMFERLGIFHILIDELGKGTVLSIFIDKDGIEVVE